MPQRCNMSARSAVEYPSTASPVRIAKLCTTAARSTAEHICKMATPMSALAWRNNWREERYVREWFFEGSTFGLLLDITPAI